MTTWLTQITPDYRNPLVRNDLRDVIDMHKRVMTLVPDDLGDQARRQAGVLYRIDESPRGPRILIQTQIHPQLAPAARRIWPGRVPRTRSRCSTGSRPERIVRYRITANTCKRKSHSTKAVALRGTAADEWWKERASRSGLHVAVPDPASPRRRRRR